MVRARLTRTLAGLASAGSLGAASLCVLVLAGDRIPFVGWPGDVDAPPAERVTVAGTEPTTGPAPSLRDAPTPAASPSADRGDSRDARARRAARRRVRARRAAQLRGATAETGAGVRPPRRPPVKLQGGGTSAPPRAPSTQPGPVRGSAVTVAETVRSTGQTAGDAVGQVSPEAGATVTDVTNAVAGKLDELAQRLP